MQMLAETDSREWGIVEFYTDVSNECLDLKRNVSELSMGMARFTFFKNPQTKDHYANHCLSINTVTVAFQELTVM